MLHLESVRPRTLELLKFIQKRLNQDEKMRLVGGTALALKHGHRISIDLDFFGENIPPYEKISGQNFLQEPKSQEMKK